MKNLVIRSLSGAIYVALIVISIIFVPRAFMLLMGIFVAIGMTEYENMVFERNKAQGPSKLAYGLDILLALLIWGCVGLMGLLFGYSLVLGFWIICALFSLRFIVAVFDKSEYAVSNVAQSVLGIFYISVPLSLISFLGYTNVPASKTYLLFTFILIWLNDTGAYLVGCKFGKRRLCERLSPKKSWEGFWGGFVFCVVAGVVFGLWFDHSVYMSAIYGGVVSVFATIGDLFESMLKRSAGVKDSGKLIPGHGGILDRIDSLLFVAIPAFLMFPFLISN